MKIVRVVLLSTLIIAILLATNLLYGQSPGPAERRDFGPRPTGGSRGDQTPGSADPKDPGPRVTGMNAGDPLSSLTASQLQYFQDGQARFNQVETVSNGLGPTYNATSCSSCHSQPAVGGSSPSEAAFPNVGANPQIAAATAGGATNKVPSFVTADGPVREARFPFAVGPNGGVTSTADGGVHDLFTIAGRSDAAGCSMAQPNFAAMLQAGNVIFRIPTPTYGAGLIENIADDTILDNMRANLALKAQLGISGHPNKSGNDGSVTRFGWKAQNKSLEVFAGEAYNVEMGVTNELFPNERGGVSGACAINPTPEDSTNFDQSGAQIPSDVVAFAEFMRFLAPPAPSTVGIAGNPSAASIANGKALFSHIHCDTCHTPGLQTAPSSLTAGLSSQTAALFSDLLVHHMGSGLADNVSQGAAGPDEFRTAPLWGLGQRIFFLHDGRSGPANGGLIHAIEQHSSPGSEASRVIALYNALTAAQKQDLLNFLRSL